MGTSLRRVLKQFRPPPWTERTDSIVRTLRPNVAAKKLGVTVRLVMARRDELGIPDVDAQFRRGVLRPARPPMSEAAENEVLRTLSPHAASVKLSLPLYVVYRRRRKLGVSRKPKVQRA